jgi:RNA polymerase sigma-70 factor (ECF subfamily)
MESRQDTSLKAPALWMSALDPEGGAAPAAEFSAILERAVAGDSAAFVQLIVRYERRVLTLAWRLMGNMDDAKDAAQEVFLRAFKYLHRYDPARPLEGWIVRIAVNVCRDLARSQRQREALPLKLDLPKHNSDPHSSLALDERKHLLDRALQGLTEKERNALILRDIEGFSTAEVASFLGLSQSAVRALIGRGRVKMRVAITRMKGGRP